MTHFDHRLSDLARRVMVRRAQDQTADTGTRSALIIAPHPDDETFGCGALIMRKCAAGAKVDICVVSDGGAFLNDEMTHDELVTMRDGNLRAALARMGVPEANLHQLGFPDGSLRDLVEPISLQIAELIRTVDADEVFIPSTIDEHPDHIAVYEACMRAAQGLGPSTRLYTYPVWYWSWGSWHRFDANVPKRVLAALRYVAHTARVKVRSVRTGDYRDAKREVFEFYKWELRDDYDFFEKWYLNDEEIFFEIRPGATVRA